MEGSTEQLFAQFEACTCMDMDMRVSYTDRVPAATHHTRHRAGAAQ